MGKDENGYIVIETIATFIPFILLVASILSLINIVALQSRVHYAITQTANTLSIYGYGLEVTGAADNIVTMNKKSKKLEDKKDQVEKNLKGVMEGLEGLSSLTDAKKHGEALVDDIKGVMDDPKDMMQNILNYGLKKSGDAVFETIARGIVEKYLRNGNIDGDEYLKLSNIKDGINGLKFDSGSTLLDENGDVVLVVDYEIEYKFGALPLPFEPKLKVRQSAKTKAWLGGSGKGYEWR